MRKGALDFSNINVPVHLLSELYRRHFKSGIHSPHPLLPLFFLFGCDYQCETPYHLSCLDPPLSSVPEGEWFCAPCTAESDSTSVPAPPDPPAVPAKPKEVKVSPKKRARPEEEENGNAFDEGEEEEEEDDDDDDDDERPSKRGRGKKGKAGAKGEELLNPLFSFWFKFGSTADAASLHEGSRPTKKRK